jgi:phosphate uptake regulator
MGKYVLNMAREGQSPEYRKIQILGRSSYAVTLPKSWVRTMNLDSGSLVVLSVDKKGGLNVVPENLYATEQEPSEKVLELKNLSAPNALGEAVKACYKIGYETVRIRHPGGLSAGSMAEIHQAVESLYGTLIVSETPNDTTLQSSIDVRTFTVKSLISRMGSFFIYLSEQAERALTEGAVEDFSAVQYRAREVDKIYSLLVRQLVQGVRSQQVASRVGLSDVIQSLGSRMVAKALRDMTRSMFTISETVKLASKGDPEDLQKVAALISELRSLYRKAYDSLLKEDIEKASEALKEHETFVSGLMELERSLASRGDPSPGVSAIVSLVRELQSMAHSVAILPEVAVNRYVEQE